MKIIVEFDDFYDKFYKMPSSIDILKDLKEYFPKFKVTLFFIPAWTSLSVMKEIKKFGFIELAYHGLNHNHGECEEWTRDRTVNILYTRKLWYGD